MENQAPDIIPELAELRKPQKAFSVPPPPELTGLSTQIGGGVPGVPTDYAAERAKYKKPEEASAQQAKLLQRQQQLETDIGTASQAKEQYLAEAKADIARQQRESAQTVEANLEATRAAFPYKEFHPTKDNIETLSTLFGLIGVVGMAMGGSGKMSAMNSLNAMSGMMKGWQQGRADLWKKEKEEFDKNMQKTKAILEDAYRDADRAMKTLAYNVQEAEALAGQSAAKLGGQVGKQILEKQGVEKFYTFLEGVKKDLTHAEDKAQEKARYEAELARKKSEDIERRAHQKRMEGFEQQKIDIQKTKAERPQRGAASQETALRVMQQDIGNAKYNLEDLKKAGEKSKELPGGSVAFANYFKGDIRSDIIRYATTQFVETDLQSNDALMLNLAFDIASAQSGGRGQLSDAKVRAVVAQMPLSEQPEETKATKWAALMTRVNEANKTLPKDKQVEIPDSLEKYFMGERYKKEGSRETSSAIDSVTGLPKKNSKGYTLETDGAGTYIYVSPDRKSYEKVE